MAITYGGLLSAAPGHAASASSVAITTNVSVPSNGTALCAVTWYGNQTPAITGWTLDKQYAIPGTPNFRVARFSRGGSLASGTTVTATFGGNVDVVDLFGEYVTSGNALLVDATGEGTGTTGVWNAPITTTAAAFLIGSTWIDFGSDPHTPATGCTEIYEFNPGGYKCMTVYRIEASAGTYGVGGTNGNGNPNVAASVAYKETAGGTDATVTAAAAVAIGDLVTPTVSSPDATVVAPVMDALGDFPDTGMIVSVEVITTPMAAVGDMTAPTVSGTSAGAVTAPVAAAAADLVAPAVSAGSGVTALVADATGDLTAPAVSAGSAVTAPVADAEADMRTPVQVGAPQDRFRLGLASTGGVLVSGRNSGGNEPAHATGGTELLGITGGAEVVLV